MKNVEYCDLLLYCTKSSRQRIDFQDHYWIKIIGIMIVIKIIGIMIVWDPNDCRINATTSENWKEYLFSGETSYFQESSRMFVDATSLLITLIDGTVKVTKFVVATLLLITLIDGTVKVTNFVWLNYFFIKPVHWACFSIVFNNNPPSTPSSMFQLIIVVAVHYLVLVPYGHVIIAA